MHFFTFIYFSGLHNLRISPGLWALSSLSTASARVLPKCSEALLSTWDKKDKEGVRRGEPNTESAHLSKLCRTRAPS